MSDEGYVRSKWERAGGRSMGNGGFAVWLPVIWCGVASVGYFKTEAEAWSAARAFTEERLEEIRQVEQEKQEIVLAITEWSLDGEGTHQSKVYARILARTEAHLADLKRGMKP